MISTGSSNLQDSAVVSEQDRHLEPLFRTASSGRGFGAA